MMPLRRLRDDLVHTSCSKRRGHPAGLVAGAPRGLRPSIDLPPRITALGGGLPGAGAGIAAPARSRPRTIAALFLDEFVESAAAGRGVCGPWPRTRRASSRPDRPRRRRSWRFTPWSPPTALRGFAGDPVHGRCWTSPAAGTRRSCRGSAARPCRHPPRSRGSPSASCSARRTPSPRLPVRQREGRREARRRQRRRYATGPICNAQLPGPLVRRESRMSQEARSMLAAAVDRRWPDRSWVRPGAEGRADDRRPGRDRLRDARAGRRGACVSREHARDGARACRVRPRESRGRPGRTGSS